MKYTELPKVKYRAMFEKILFVLRIILSISVITTASLELTNILNSTNNISQPLLGCMFFVMFLEYRNYNKLQSCLSLATSIFLFFVWIIVTY
ncbi:hypothetical protein K7185_08050 [Clostridium butyricum]|uniref:hypothetical protein n=1 Tax=Clostridium butyricum TaxID=1492 RepID=UPI001CA9BD96|nr:hypothetical protein [Clostridium butyricum]MBZ0312423.1 hypothetical protein [Clostridium butyricum]